jgi:L-fuculose-phosphate aldolase
LATPSGFAKRSFLYMPADQILEVDIDGDVLKGRGEVTSSWITHAAVYRNFEAVQAVIHAHPLYASAFSVQGRSMPPVLSVMNKYGEIPCLTETHIVDSKPFAEELVSVLNRHVEALSNFGFAVLYPKHGVLIGAPELEIAYDLLERIEANAIALLLPG